MMNQGVKIVICRAKRLRWYPNPFTTHPTREMIILVKLVFTAATLCFVLGYANRFRNNPLHQRLMLSGFLLTLAFAVVLVLGVYGFGESAAAAGWLVRVTGGARVAGPGSAADRLTRAAVDLRLECAARVNPIVVPRLSPTWMRISR